MRMYRGWAVALLLALAAAAGAAPVVADVKAALKPVCERHGLPALAGAIVTSERLVALGAVGRRNADQEVPVTANDRFHLGSCTKAMTATLLAMAVEDGRLKWSTTIAEAYAALTDDIQPAFRTVTLEQLLQHRGGFSPMDRNWPEGKDFTDMHDLPGTPREQRQAYLKLVLSQPPAFQPGAYHYSNMGYTVAAGMLEEAAKRSWEELITERLFQPLGMASAGFGPPGSSDDFIEPWAHKLDGKTLVPLPPEPFLDNPPVLSPGGRVHANLTDWAKFVALHLRGARGQAQLIGAESFRRLHTPARGSDYAAGWLVYQRDWGGGTVLTHSGTNLVNYATTWLAPRRDFAVLVATNLGGGPAIKGTDEAAAALVGYWLERAPAGGR